MSGERLLVVDDEDLVRDALRRILQSAGYRVESAASGQAALLEMDRAPYDLMLLDLHMPEISGVAVLREAMRRGVPPPATIVLTGYGSMDKMAEAMALGAARFLTKPVYPQDLLEAVSGVLSRVRGRQRRERSLAYAPLLATAAAVADPSINQQEAVLRGLDALRGAVQATSVVCYLGDASKGLTLAATAPEGSGAWASRVSPPVATRAEAWIAKGDGIRLVGKGCLSWPDLAPMESPRSSTLAAPIVDRGRLVGLLAVMAPDRGGSPFDAGDIEVLWLAAVLLAGAVR